MKIISQAGKRKLAQYCEVGKELTMGEITTGTLEEEVLVWEEITSAIL